ncbi:NADH pyrophosphatase [Rhizobium albus]|nr:NADH pyrophosphatase [Rhizobium albus]
MTSLFTGTGAEPSARVAFAGNRLQRLSEKRPAGCLEDALSAPKTRIFGFIGGKLLLDNRQGEPQAGLSLSAFEALSPDRSNAILLGYDKGVAQVAMPLKADVEALPEGLEALAPRGLYLKHLLPDETVGIVAQGTAMVNWTLSSQFCGVCGGRTVSEAGGYRRRCPETEGGCGTTLFPRTDPVVIMLAIDEAEDRCLLGRSPHFPPGFYSCLAGFLEPGETMEDAVRRETHEESGISVGQVRYHASQPWPMPHTMMVGFYAQALSMDIAMDGDELEDCRWFTRQEAVRLLERIEGELTTAPDGTIANRLLRDWVARS